MANISSRVTSFFTFSSSACSPYPPVEDSFRTMFVVELVGPCIIIDTGTLLRASLCAQLTIFNLLDVFHAKLCYFPVSTCA